MAKIFLTGGTGFLGSYILRFLIRDGHEIYATQRTHSKMDHIADIKDQINWTICDIEDVDQYDELIDNETIIIHAAAKISFDKKHQGKMHRVNVDATRLLVNVALEKRAKRFIHISSIAALGRYHDNRAIDENIEWEDSPHHTTYGISKQMGEREVWRGRAEGLDVVILNPSLILGAGYWNSSSSNILRQLDRGLSFYPEGMTGMVDVRDVAKLASLAITKEVTGQRYIISAENRTYKDYFAFTCKELDRKIPHRPLTKIWRSLAWRSSGIYAAISRKSQLVTSQNMAASASSTKYDNQKSINDFGYSYTMIEKTWLDAAQSYKKAKIESRSWGTLSIEGF